MFSMKKVTLSELTRSMFVPVVLGLAGGIVGALIIESYFTSLSAALNEPLQIGRPTASSSAQIPQADLADRLRRVNVPLYARRATSAGAELAERSRGVSEAIGYATVLTSDGWLATSASVASTPVSVAVGGKLLDPKTQIADPRTGLVFLKVEATALPVSAFEETDALRAGSPLYALDEAGLFAATSFAGTFPIDRKALVPSLQNSDRFGHAFRVSRVMSLRASGGAVLATDGNLAGILLPDKAGAASFVPMHLIRPVLAQVFRGRVPARAQLGVSYLSLEDVAVSEGGFGAVKGERLTGSRALGIPAVRSGSAAAKAGLQEGDVLLRADGVDLLSGRDLAEVIAEAEIGSKIRFDVLKDGAERSVEVTLDGEKR